ncbi:MAG TPA: glycerol-3-phosphate dehydrogenase [Aliidongia sp.]|nr:glycerol-3-phosphate dehydrogenase [Aliidongia sp.]
MAADHDLLIVGGGINGAGIARDAAGRGHRVLLCEQGDLAQATSSASTKLIHGGLRYLEYYEFRLVREALIERERLLAIAPHIIWPLRFILPHEAHLRPAWMIRLGLFLYDHLGGRRRLPASEGVSLAGGPLKPEFRRGFAYSDCWVEDSRLVALNAVDARRHGAEILTRTRLAEAARRDGVWTASLEDVETGARRSVTARILVNAAGPWVAETLGRRLGLNSAKHVRLIKGSHIIVPRLYEGEHAYMLQNPDRRIIFTIPYEQRFTLIGTTDLPFEGDPAKVAISAEEIDYLCGSVARYFTRPCKPADMVWSYAGVRPLYDDAAENASAVTRDYVLDLDAPAGEAPLLSVFGGKITTYRRLAEHALEKLGPHLQGGKSWTAGEALPGGDLPDLDFERFLAGLMARRPFLPAALARRLARAYGTRVEALVGEARALADLGQDFGGGLTRAEVDYLVAEEWARSAEDILWRRSKLGLHVPAGTAERLADYLAGSEQPRRAGEGRA